ncbi:hypothetical protein SAZ10_29975 [Mesorhizobium sp. BAC0120]|uniref:hypothetical protein n=1 Tax=Mesorhizobium sp. BAC0120 TaxID=3090670 RepID=UPI00298CBBBA|nr:hypothetical protein [Mesorhizobium sp. BAC0120]MDW6025994.1 hypothetical protein [Mesorhizobium sp. BAC0120]
MRVTHHVATAVFTLTLILATGAPVPAGGKTSNCNGLNSANPACPDPPGTPDFNNITPQFTQSNEVLQGAKPADQPRSEQDRKDDGYLVAGEDDCEAEGVRWSVPNAGNTLNFMVTEMEDDSNSPEAAGAAAWKQDKKDHPDTACLTLVKTHPDALTVTVNTPEGDINLNAIILQQSLQKATQPQYEKWADVGWWEIDFKTPDNTCVMRSWFDEGTGGQTTLEFTAIWTKDDVRHPKMMLFTLTNPTWATRFDAGQEYELKFTFGRARGTSWSELKREFTKNNSFEVITPDPDLITVLMDSNWMQITHKGKIIANLSLKDSGRAVEEALACQKVKIPGTLHASDTK